MSLIGLDADGVLYDQVGGILQHVNVTYGLNIRREDIKQYNLAGLTGNEQADRDIIDLLQDPTFYWGLRPFDGVKEALYRLQAAGHTFVVITSRPRKAYTGTRHALERDFPGLAIIDCYTTGKKTRYARSLRVRYMVEDHAPTAEDLAKWRVRTFLMLRSYTGAYRRRGRYLIPVNTMAEVADYILRPPLSDVA